jgi:hypothetical protein
MMIMGVARLELARPLQPTDFKSAASTIPPHPQFAQTIIKALKYYLAQVQSEKYFSPLPDII